MYRYAIYERDDNYNGLIRLGTWNEKGEPVELKLNHTSHLYYVDPMYDNDSEETNYTTLTGKNLVRENFPNTSLRYKWIEQHPNVKLYDSLDPITEFLHEHFHDVHEDPDFAKYPLKSYFYDIETAIGDRFPDPEIADQQITVITVGDLRTNNLYTWANLAGPWKDSVQNKFKNLIEYFKIISQLRKEKFDIAFDCQRRIKSLPFMRFCGAKRRIISKHSTEGAKYGANEILPTSPDSNHMVLWNLDYATYLGLDTSEIKMS